MGLSRMNWKLSCPVLRGLGSREAARPLGERTSSRAGVAPAEAQRLFTAHVKWRCYIN